MTNITRLNSNLIEPNNILEIPLLIVPDTSGLEQDKKYSLAFVNGNFTFLEMSELSRTDIVEGKITTVDTKTSILADTGNIFYWLVNGNKTLEILNIPNLIYNQSYILVLRMVNGGNFVITYPSNWKWVGGAIPAFSKVGIDEICVIYYPDGTTTVNYALNIK